MTISRYEEKEPTSSEVETLSGPAVIQFGNDWCGFCQRAQPFIVAAMEQHPEIPHWYIADSSGKPLGRYFRVKLWPTLIFLLDGKEITRVVRPDNTSVIQEALAKICT
ncbi:MAG: thioredoxin [Tolumonas sp.]|nr:MAG: thioredoxin [Tolumonas sp.]